LNQWYWRAIIVGFAFFFLTGCAGRPTGQLIPVAAVAPGTSEVDMDPTAEPYRGILEERASA
jgi:hypothetical protein